MLTAFAFICAAAASDCEREALARVIVGQGMTPIGCLSDGQAGAAANAALVIRPGERIVIACRRATAP